MSNSNTPNNFFYDSDEDVSWGPITAREIKRDLKREAKLPSNYRRQTLSFVSSTIENKPEMFTIANSTNSNEDYFTANESLGSNNIQSSDKVFVDACNTIPIDSLKSLSILNKADKSECSEVIILSSDGEFEDEQESYHVKSEQFSYSQSTKYNSFSSGKDASTSDIIYLSSSDEEEPKPGNKENESCAHIHDTFNDSFEAELTPKIQSPANTPVKKANYSISQSTNQDYSLSSVCEEIESSEMSRQMPKIRIIARTPVKKNTDSLNSSIINEKQNSSFAAIEAEISKTPRNQSNISTDQNDRSFTGSRHWMVTDKEDISNNEMAIDTPQRQMNCSSINFYYRDHFLGEDNKLISPKAEMKIPKINVISNTPIKGPTVSPKNNSDPQDLNSIEDYQQAKPELSNESDDCHHIGNNSSENRNLFESPSGNAKNSSINDHKADSLNSSLYELNLSQKMNEYDYCEEINHTLSFKLQLDLSSKNSDELKSPDEIYKTAYNSVNASNKLDLSGIHAFPTNSPTNPRNDSSNFNDFDNTRSESATSKELHNTHYESMSDCMSNSCMNDTLSEIERLLAEGLDSDSDDSSEEIIDSTSCNHPRPAFGNSSIQNISRIPVPKSFSDDSKGNSSIGNKFKIPKLPTKVIKKTPVDNKLASTKTSQLLKNIVSPVRLYINNSPVAPLKQINKPACAKSHYTLYGISENTRCVPKKRRNLLDSLPEVVYKPCKMVREKCDNLIILPNNIRKLISERIVIKHEPRRRINPDESMYSVGDKLEMTDLSVIVSDDQNMSVHTTKHGYNL